QKRAQREVDSVTSCERLPTYRDVDHFMYLRQVMQELLRWASSSELLQHSSSRDGEYMEYHLPRGTTIHADLWTMFHDSSVYAQPNDFNP
ncbi:cytochrome P450, partial [Exidia glandulosa HHB12029]